MADPVIESRAPRGGHPPGAPGAGTPPTSLMFRNQARRLALAGHHGEALALLDAVPDEEVDGRLRLLRGKILVQSGDLAAARTELAAAHELAPDDPDVAAAHALAQRLDPAQGASVPRYRRVALLAGASVLGLVLLAGAAGLGFERGRSEPSVASGGTETVVDPRIAEAIRALEKKIEDHQAAVDEVRQSDEARRAEADREDEELRRESAEQGAALTRQEAQLAAMSATLERLDRRLGELAAAPPPVAEVAGGDLAAQLERQAGETEILSTRVLQVESELTRSHEDLSGSMDEIQRSVGRIQTTLDELSASGGRRPRKSPSGGGE